jgi:NAD(P)-dependent dehydrogenase (short-subunit alcohol dehydrogenase family)
MPSVIDTPANRKAMADASFDRWVKPEALAAHMLWLASEEARDISGALVPVYGRD